MRAGAAMLSMWSRRIGAVRTARRTGETVSTQAASAASAIVAIAWFEGRRRSGADDTRAGCGTGSELVAPAAGTRRGRRRSRAPAHAASLSSSALR